MTSHPSWSSRRQSWRKVRNTYSSFDSLFQRYSWIGSWNLHVPPLMISLTVCPLGIIGSTCS